MSNRYHSGFIHSRLAGWIAIAAIVFSALAPTIAHAFPAKNTSLTLWQELCTSRGSKLLVAAKLLTISAPTAVQPAQPGAPSTSQPSPEKMGMHFEHCPYCFSHAGSVGLPPASASMVYAAIGQTAQPAELYISPVLALYFQSANPSQAPPSLS